MKYFIKTFGCQQNVADSERLASYYEARGYVQAQNLETTDIAVINTCVVRQQAENRIYGLVKNLLPMKEKNPQFKIVVTGCLVGTALREPSGETAQRLKKNLRHVDEFLPIEEVGFEYQAIRNDTSHAWIPITHGCNNFCTFCIVPYSRGREKSRPFEDIVKEVEGSVKKGYKKFTLLGQNVNSYGSDIIKNEKEHTLPGGKKIRPIMVRHLGRSRIPTLFPHLLESLSKMKRIEKISFMSSNPWDFSNELINAIAKNTTIDRIIHLPVQSGDNEVLHRMNRWYTKKQYLNLIENIRKKVHGVSFTTDIIIGFPNETKDAFEQTVDLAKKVKFEKAYISCYSPRPGTASAKIYEDNVPYEEKKRRFHVLDRLINHAPIT